MAHMGDLTATQRAVLESTYDSGVIPQEAIDLAARQPAPVERSKIEKHQSMLLYYQERAAVETAQFGKPSEGVAREIRHYQRCIENLTRATALTTQLAAE